MKFYLDFQSDDFGKKVIDEPFGTSDINFSLNQKDKGLARDISFSGNEIQFEFTKHRNHYLDQILYYNRLFGFEAVVVLTIEVDENNSYKCDLDFATAETDDLEYFRCKGVEDGKLQIIKARREVKVDVLSDLDIDGNYIGKLVPENMLLLAKPVKQVSRWEQPSEYITILGNLFVKYALLNPCIDLIKSDIEDSSTFFKNTQRRIAPLNQSDFQVLKAVNNLKNVTISIKDMYLDFRLKEIFLSNKYLGSAYSCLEIRHGIDFTTATQVKFLETNLGGLNGIYNFSGNINHTIENINRGEFLWISFNIKFDPIIYINIKNMKIEISADSQAYNSVTKSLRLVDVMRQVVKSISGLDINAPRFENEFYDNRLINGNFLRQITDKPFYVSLEDIEKSITEMNADYEIGSDGKVFFGIEEDYYRPVEVGFFDDTQFSQMNKTFNPKFKVNEFGFKYKNFQSLKENEEPSSADTIHGESKWVFFNKGVENKKEVEVQWTRDAFLIEEIRRKSITVKDNTATQNDDTIFALDTVNTTFDNEFIETADLLHEFLSSSNKLSLKNDGSLNFKSLGITVGSLFTIMANDINQGDYTVISITENTLILSKNSGSISGAGNGNRLTKFKYTLSKSFIPFTNYTNQGFTETENLNASDNYSNRRYSIKRNIYNYYQAYLATCNLFWKDKPIKNTWYKNNGDYKAKYGGITLTEKVDLIPVNPILSPVLYNEVIFANVEFADFITLSTNIRSQRGFIRSIDNNEQVIKIYPMKMGYSLTKMELMIKGEAKYEPVVMSIVVSGSFILINNETRVDSLYWELIDNRLSVFDVNRYRLYNTVDWFSVSINYALSNTIKDLEDSLKLIK